MGAKSGSGVPSPDDPWHREVQRVHDRYLVEVVEGLNLCPFARRCREAGRVHRPVFRAHSALESLEVARTLEGVIRDHCDAEIVLLTFVVEKGHPWQEPRTFEAFAREVQQAYRDHCDAPRFYMVTFHPDSGRGGPEQTTRDSLVALLRRTPDPVIQCVRADVLDAARSQAQQHAHARLTRELQDAPSFLRALLDNSIQTESELSLEIARNNFATVGMGPGLARLESSIHDIALDRERSYGSDSMEFPEERDD